MGRIGLYLALTLSIVGSTACAATASRHRPLAVGDRARVHASGSVLGYSSSWIRSRTGAVTAVTPDSLVLSVPQRSEALVVPAYAIQRLYVSEGKRSRRRSALMGAGIGLVAGALAGWAVDDPSSAEVPTGTWVASGAGLGLVLGAGLGAALGGGERWRAATLPTGTGLAPLAPTWSLRVALAR